MVQLERARGYYITQTPAEARDLDWDWIVNDGKRIGRLDRKDGATALFFFGHEQHAIQDVMAALPRLRTEAGLGPIALEHSAPPGVDELLRAAGKQQEPDDEDDDE